MQSGFELLDHPFWSRAGQLTALLLARLVPVISLTPAFGGEASLARLRLGIALLLVMVLAPPFYSTFQPAETVGAFIALLAKDALVGILFGIIILILFEFVGVAGKLVDVVSGARVAELRDPLRARPASPLGALFTYTFLAAFASVGGYRLLIGSLADSLLWIPPGGEVPAEFFTESRLLGIVSMTGKLLGAAIQFVAPIMVTMLLIDVAMSLIRKMVANMNISSFGMIIKPLAALVFLGFIVSFLMEGFLGIAFSAIRGLVEIR